MEPRNTPQKIFCLIWSLGAPDVLLKTLPSQSKASVAHWYMGYKGMCMSFEVLDHFCSTVNKALLLLLLLLLLCFRCDPHIGYLNCISCNNCSSPKSMFIIHQIFLFAGDWFKHVMWTNIPQLKLSIFKTASVAKKIWRIINTLASIWCENMLGHLSLDIICSSNLTYALGKLFASRNR